MLVVENHRLSVDGITLELPHLPVSATLKVWRVPTEYRDSGIFFSLTPDGGVEEYPACAGHEFIGETRVEAHPEAALESEKQRNIADIKATAAAAIEALSWRIERARERDLLGLPGETVNDVLLEREAIRRASNRVEQAIETAQSLDELRHIAFAVTDDDRATSARLTRLEFLRRFTDAEMQSIVAAADASPALKAALLKWQTAEGIVLTDPATIAGVQALEIAGLIAPGRAQEVLQP